MDVFQRELELIDKHYFKSLPAAVLARLAGGMTITRAARDLGVSRSSVYKMLKKPGFRKALLKEARYQASVAVIEQRCLSYRRAILKTVIRVYSNTTTL